MNPPRHIKIFCIPVDGIGALAREGATFRCMRGIPEDAKIVGVQYDVARDAFVIGCEHPSYPPVDPNVVPSYDWIVLERV